MKTSYLAVHIALLAGFAAGQAPAPRMEFEVASIRPFTTNLASGDQVTAGLHLDGGQLRAVGLTLKDYIGIAYQFKPNQVTGPDWITSERYDITAKIPEGSKPDDVREMMKSLLEDRFRLKFHRESKEFPVYFLETLKSGAKLTESPLAPAPSDPEEAKKGFTAGGSGGRNGIGGSIGNGASYSFANNRFEGTKLTLDQAADLLQTFMDRRVVNRTGLTKTYDIAFDLSADDYRVMLIRAGVNNGVTLPAEALRLLDLPSGDSLTVGLEKFGLKLTPGKSPFDVIVVDQANKTPTEN